VSHRRRRHSSCHIVVRSTGGKLLLEYAGGRHHFRFDDLHDYETASIEAHGQSRIQPKVTWREIRGLRWFGGGRNAFHNEELPNTKRCVALCVIVKQKPLSVSVVALCSELHGLTALKHALRNYP
jgi:hypothetical protein